MYNDQNEEFGELVNQTTIMRELPLSIPVLLQVKGEAMEASPNLI